MIYCSVSLFMWQKMSQNAEVVGEKYSTSCLTAKALPILGNARRSGC